MSTVPFYSPEVRDALAEIIAGHRDEEDADGPAAASSAADPSPTSSSATAAIRGTRGGHDSSSSDEDEGVNDEGGSDSDGVSSSSSSSSRSLSLALEPVEENEEGATDAIDADASPNDERRARKGKHPGGKRSKNKRSKDDLLQRMGKAPSMLLPFDAIDANDGAKKKPGSNKALEVPSVLLPSNYLRDNPNWKPSSVARSLLSTWERLNGTSNPTIIVVLLQSGRFAAAVFALHTHHNVTSMKMLAHKTSTRYTVRKGQGGSQSNYDQSKHKAKSVGAQLRREGEKQLREDVRQTWKEWRKLGYVDRALWVYASCPKGMRRDYLFDDDGSGLVEKGDTRLRNVPLDVGRPTMEATAAVLDCVLSCSVRDMTGDELSMMMEGLNVADGTPIEKVSSEKVSASDQEKAAETEEPETAEEEAPPLTPLHEAVLEGDLERLLELLKLLDESEETNNARESASETVYYDINTVGGPDHQTPLHLASSSTHQDAASIVNELLVRGHANPCAVDARGRPPYFLASSDRVREAFRLARGTLGEEYCRWDDGAKVGPALSESDVQAKKAKALEKKRRQRARQKEKKAAEKAEAEREAAKEKEEEERRKAEDDAKRVRDGLKPKSGASNACDFCQKVVRGKRRGQMFQRLDYAYCSTDCVKRHQRELMAAAAAARMG